MKMYKVFELADHRFTWAGGCFINIYYTKGDYVNNKVDTIEFYEVTHSHDDREVAFLCLDWLEKNEIITEAVAYKF
jgi:hypothetical protein